MEENLAHHKSTKKRIITNEKRRMRNRSIKSELKTYIRYFMEALEEAKEAENRAEMKEAVAEKLKKTVSQLQKTNSKGVMHKNTVSRKIGRLTRKFNKVFAEK